MLQEEDEAAGLSTHNCFAATAIATRLFCVLKLLGELGTCW